MSHHALRVGLILGVLVASIAAQVPESRPASRPAPEKITFALVAPAAESRATDSRAPRPVAVIRVTNENAVPVTLWPFVSLQIRDAKGAERKPSSNRGRWGLRKQKCFLEGVQFTTVPAGKSVDWPVRLDQYMHDPNSILGWKLEPGAYTLTAHYAFSRSDFIARCDLDCPSHAEATRPWNTALEIVREASLAFTVK